MNKGSEDATFKRVVRFFTLEFEKGSSFGKFTLSQKKGMIKKPTQMESGGGVDRTRRFLFYNGVGEDLCENLGL